MPKRVNNIFYDNLKYKYMYSAYTRASKNKHFNKDVILYELDLSNNITNALKRLYSNKYFPGKYNEFIITKPKKRVIRALPFPDRVVQQWFVEQFIKPIFIPSFIDDSYACLPKRGVHNAAKKAHKYMFIMKKKCKDAYVLKCDVSKFFYSINKEILFNLIKRKVKDKNVLELARKFIYDTNNEVGIPIGNYTSQYFANIYLNELDHFVKEECKVKYYIRYVDDFILILDSKDKCKEIKKKVVEFLYAKLRLKLNNKTSFVKIDNGVNFLGYKIFPTHILLRKTNKKKIYKYVRMTNKLYNNKKLDCLKALRTLKSWKGHASVGDTVTLINDVFDKCDWIVKNNYDYYVDTK